MLITATSKYVRISPEKLRLITRGFKKNSFAENSLVYFTQMPQKGSFLIAKVIKQAIASATNNFNQQKQSLKLKQILVNEGPFLKRYNPISRGTMHPILRRMSHITVVLEAPDDKGKRVKEQESKKEKTNV